MGRTTRRWTPSMKAVEPPAAWALNFSGCGAARGDAFGGGHKEKADIGQ